MKNYDVIRAISNRRFYTFVLIALMVFGYLATSATALTGEYLAACKINAIFCTVARIIFMVAGGLAGLIIIIAGMRWITSGEDPGARNAAKNTVISAVIGLIIIVLSVYIVSIIVSGMLPNAFAVDIVQWMDGTQACDANC